MTEIESFGTSKLPALYESLQYQRAISDISCSSILKATNFEKIVHPRIIEIMPCGKQLTPSECVNLCLLFCMLASVTLSGECDSVINQIGESEPLLQNLFNNKQFLQRLRWGAAYGPKCALRGDSETAFAIKLMSWASDQCN
jgi:hypothetical protein